jgi:hypothetical protein
MAERDYSGELPTKPPDDMIPWLIKQGHLKKELLVYKMDGYTDPLTRQRVRAVELICTACKRKVYTDKVPGPCNAAYAPAPYGFVHPETKEHLISGNCCLCPECGVETKAIHVGHMRHGLMAEECYPTTVIRIDNKLAIIGWCILKNADKDGSISYFQHGYEAYVVEQKGIVRLAAYLKTLGNMSWGDWKQRKKYEDKWGRTGPVYPWDARLLKGSTAENSKLDILLRATKEDGTYPITYLRHWQKKPQIENLVMQGASVLLTEMIKKEDQGHSFEISVQQAFAKAPLRGFIDWREVSPAKMLGLTRDEFRRCVKEKWDVATLDFWKQEKKAGRALSTEDLLLARLIGYHECRRLRSDKCGWMKVARYIQRQRKKDRRVDIGIYKDYCRIAREIGEDMNLPAVQFPPRLMAAHDRVEQVRRWKEEEKKKAERDKRRHLFAERFAELSMLAWEFGGILIRPIRDEEELSWEGQKLNHCVGSYASTHVKGEKPLFVIRRADDPETPWFTLQLNVKDLTVAQNRGKSNCDRTKEIEKFEAAWVGHIREQAERTKPKRKRQRARVAVAV